MRHVGSLLLALLLAPPSFVLAGRGLGGLAEVASAAPQAERTDYFAIVTAAAALGLAGLMLSLLSMARLPPLGPTLAGAGYLAVGIWALVDADQLLATVPGELVGLDQDGLAAVTTASPLLAVPLLVTLFLPGRWQGRWEGQRRRFPRPGPLRPASPPFAPPGLPWPAPPLWPPAPIPPPPPPPAPRPAPAAAVMTPTPARPAQAGPAQAQAGPAEAGPAPPELGPAEPAPPATISRLATDRIPLPGPDPPPPDAPPDPG